MKPLGPQLDPNEEPVKIIKQAEILEAEETVVEPQDETTVLEQNPALDEFVNPSDQQETSQVIQQPQKPSEEMAHIEPEETVAVKLAVDKDGNVSLEVLDYNEIFLRLEQLTAYKRFRISRILEKQRQHYFKPTPQDIYMKECMQSAGYFVQFKSSEMNIQTLDAILNHSPRWSANVLIQGCQVQMQQDQID